MILAHVAAGKSTRNVVETAIPYRLCANIGVIDQPEVIKVILQHVGLWKRECRPPPKTKTLTKGIQHRCAKKTALSS